MQSSTPSDPSAALDDYFRNSRVPETSSDLASSVCAALNAAGYDIVKATGRSADLRVIPCEPRGDDVRRALLDILVLARRRELSSVAIAYVDRDGCSGCAYSAAPSRATQIGSVEAMKHRLLQSWLGA